MPNKTHRTITLDHEVDLWLRMNRDLNFSEICNTAARALMDNETNESQDIATVRKALEDLEEQKNQLLDRIVNQHVILEKLRKEDAERRAERQARVAQEADALRRVIADEH